MVRVAFFIQVYIYTGYREAPIRLTYKTISSFYHKSKIRNSVLKTRTIFLYLLPKTRKKSLKFVGFYIKKRIHGLP